MKELNIKPGTIIHCANYSEALELFKSKWVVKKLEDRKIDIAGALKSLTEKEG